MSTAHFEPPRFLAYGGMLERWHTLNQGGQPKRSWRRPFWARCADSEVEFTARFLELLACSAGLVEALRELKIASMSDVDPTSGEPMIALVHHLMGYWPEKVFEEHAKLAQELQKRSESDPPPTDTHEAFDILVGAVCTFVVACPLTAFGQLASGRAEFEWLERCRRAHGVLRAFVRRHDPAQEDTREGVMRAFAGGAISLTEAADYLGMKPGDAVAYMEKRGSCRDVEALRLAGDKRDEVLQRIREDSTAGDHADDAEHDARRSAISNMRLEGVDARPWLRPKQA